MVAPPKVTRIALAEATDTYLDRARQQQKAGHLSATTVTTYGIDLRDFTDLIGEAVIVDDITGEDIDDALSKYADLPDRRYSDPHAKDAPGRSPATQARFRQSINRFFTAATRDGWVQANPMQWSVVTPKVRGGLRPSRTALVLEQALALLEHGAGAPLPQGESRPHEQNHARDRFLIAALTVLGPRVDEVCSADTTDITHSEDGGWSWRIVGKGGKPRDVPLSPELVTLRDAYLSDRPEPPQWLPAKEKKDAERALFRTGRGRRMSARDVQRLLVRARERVSQVSPGLARDVTPHGLRHTAATLMLARGWDVKVVAQLVGHSSIDTTGRYLDEIPGELAAAVAAHPLLSGLRAPEEVQS